MPKATRTLTRPRVPDRTVEVFEVAWDAGPTCIALLTAGQADGLTCVDCGALPARARPVGRVVGGAQVFACIPCCPTVTP